jgi:ketoreductase RED2
MGSSPVALVVGSSSGMGAAIARRLAADGMAVGVNSVRSVAAGEQLAAELPGAAYFRADATDPEQAPGLVRAVVEHFGRLDTLVYAAGRTQRIPHRELDLVTDEVWSALLTANLLGPWRMVKAAAPHLREAEDGNVVFIGSLAAAQAGGSSIPYAVSKAAVHHLCVMLAVALGPEIRVNTVAPGFIETPWTQGWNELRADMSGRAPLKRVGRPEEVAEIVSGLTRQTYVTGQIVYADGGFRLVP